MMRGFQVVINDLIFSAIMIGTITLDFLFAMAARFGYGSDGSDVRCGVLPVVSKTSTSMKMLDLKQLSLMLFFL
jgi:hypothetical protein